MFLFLSWNSPKIGPDLMKKICKLWHSHAAVANVCLLNQQRVGNKSSVYKKWC